MIIENNIIKVKTSEGMKPHGFIKEKKFCRNVREKDRMRIFDAWSINPEVFKFLQENNIQQLHYKDEVKDYLISMEDAIAHGFEKTFSGGPTFYIPRKFWNQ